MEILLNSKQATTKRETSSLKRTISIHQPAYLPWLGYFDKILRSDIFVFLDCVQYEKNSFINRNKIKSKEGGMWLTVPVLSKGHLDSSLLETRIDQTKNWKKKHLQSIEMNYGKAPRFQKQNLLDLFRWNGELISDLCFEQLKFWFKEIGYQPEIIRASNLAIEGAKSNLILKICEELNATHYISGSQGREYIDEKEFQLKKVEVVYQSYTGPSYSQLHGEFIPNLSVLDAWMNVDLKDLLKRG